MFVAHDNTTIPGMDGTQKHRVRPEPNHICAA
ncbi:hypothetical protein SPHV1_2350006 [Novosphingobium sp. KN65.2]|nr:hypothetical protein SPHV1_2350006 [Novosphingobium sp. KN65.2]